MAENPEDAGAAPFRAQQADLSPLETFIWNQLESARAQVNTFSSAKEHTRLLLDAAKRRKMRPQKIGHTNVSTFALARSEEQIAGIYGMTTTLVSHQALRLASSRELTRQCLVVSEIPYLTGKTFHFSQPRAAAAFMERLGRPVSVRPASPAIRTGISAHLDTAEQLAEAWKRAVNSCSKLPVARRMIDVEAFLPWVPLRIFVVGENAVAAVARVPLYVVGDGTQTLRQLALAELKRRNAPAFLEPLKGVRAMGLLQSRELDPGKVLPEGRLQLLSYDNNGQQGQGWSMDVLDHLSEDLVELAVNAMWAFPGLDATAVDVLTPKLNSAKSAVVAGIEPGADLQEFRFPAFGVCRFPNRAIMDRLAGPEI
jgi:D-alanine-D-alanine ligase-like ATP-grasp enzyme